MKVLVSGITGFVGSHLADYILANHPDVEIHGIKRWRSPLDNISHILDKIIFHDVDLTDFSAVFSFIRDNQFDKIFHLAAQSYVPYSYTNPCNTLQTNVMGTVNLLEAIRLAGQDPLIHICSSSEVYGQVEESEVPIDEGCPLRPVSPYGVSKLAEDMLGWQYYKAYGMRIVRTRAFTHTGARRGEVFAESSFAKQLMMIKTGRQPAIIFCGNLDSMRSWCDVRDMVRAYWLLTENMAGEVYNIGGTRFMSVGEILSLQIKLAGMEDTSLKIDRKARLRPADVTLQYPDCSKFNKATGWEAEIPLEETLKGLLQFWRERV